jgi:hypothetical protein
MNKHKIRVRAPFNGRKTIRPTLSSAATRQTADWPEPHVAHLAIPPFA